ncbi:hypothetical protein D0T84_05065 [Dysgonomonas sp. 521]|uniref:hypothetical protein n=1 Tax=Dysgonomonas sp. 521 TaxID=2302932 RepID=UPI0013D4BD6D|nr:hypothetical protein [Dysgonomonas sp. 521]NDV94290.1 hypothetical protein [Dysgonomonas sp. 521]
MLKYLLLLFFTILSFTVNAQEKINFKISGALRFNIASENYESSNTLDTYMKFDTWFLSVDSRYKDLDMSIQYRFYPGSKVHFIHHAYIGYKINKNWYTKLGVFQKPFGIGDFASHSWWFQIPYYMGLEDTYNTGIGLEYAHNNLKFEVAYFRQAAPKGFFTTNTEDTSVGNSRFSYAIVPSSGNDEGAAPASIQELDQFNSRVRYQLSKDIECGISGQFGSIYNTALNKRKWGLTWALHTVIDYRKWNFKGEFIHYHYNAVNDLEQPMDVVPMAAYGLAYDVATKGNIYVAGISYTIPVNHKFLKTIQPYIDYSIVSKSKKGYYTTQHLVPGVLIVNGPLYTHIDMALGKNQPWLTNDFGEGLAKGRSNARWNSRFNINVGYYF